MKAFEHKIRIPLLVWAMIINLCWSTDIVGKTAVFYSVGFGTAQKNVTIVDQVDTSTVSVYQERMNAVVAQLFQQHDRQQLTAAVKKIEVELQGFYKAYWKAYLYYYQAIYFKSIEKNDDQAEKAINSALQILEEKTYENSEYYALLAACTSFSIQYVNVLKLSKVSSMAIQYAQQSLALNKSNLRAYWVLASHNFHTPKMFGGMEKVEDYALKGLGCPNALDSTPYSPSWGREELYQLLLQFYEMEGRTADLVRVKKKYATQI